MTGLMLLGIICAVILSPILLVTAVIFLRVFLALAITLLIVAFVFGLVFLLLGLGVICIPILIGLAIISGLCTWLFKGKK